MSISNLFKNYIKCVLKTYLSLIFHRCCPHWTEIFSDLLKQFIIMLMRFL